MQCLWCKIVQFFSCAAVNKATGIEPLSSRSVHISTIEPTVLYTSCVTQPVPMDTSNCQTSLMNSSQANSTSPAAVNLVGTLPTSCSGILPGFPASSQPKSLAASVSTLPGIPASAVSSSDGTKNSGFNPLQLIPSMVTISPEDGVAPADFGDNWSQKCDVCGQQFYKRSKLENHLRIHRMKSPFRCKICGRLFGTSPRFKSHVISHSYRQPTRAKGDGDDSDKTLSLASNRSENNAERAGDVGDEGLTESMIRADVGASEAGEPSRTVARNFKTYDCTKCTSSFKKLCNLRQHMKSKHNIVLQTLACKKCPQQFVAVEALLEHVTATHAVDRGSIVDPAKYYTASASEYRHRCPECGREFTRSSDLTRHATLMHAGFLNTCLVCGNRFAHPEHLRIHIRSHEAALNRRDDDHGTSEHGQSAVMRSSPSFGFRGMPTPLQAPTSGFPGYGGLPVLPGSGFPSDSGPLMPPTSLGFPSGLLVPPSTSSFASLSGLPVPPPSFFPYQGGLPMPPPALGFSTCDGPPMLLPDSGFPMHSGPSMPPLPQTFGLPALRGAQMPPPNSGLRTTAEQPRATTSSKHSRREPLPGEELHRCTVCGKVYRYEWWMLEHLQTHVAVSSTAISCKACHVRFPSEMHLYQHMTTSHVSKFTANENISGKNEALGLAVGHHCPTSATVHHHRLSTSLAVSGAASEPAMSRTAAAPVPGAVNGKRTATAKNAVT